MNELTIAQEQFLKRFRSGFFSRLYLLFYVPTLFFWRARINQLDGSKCSVSIPFNFRNKNPFRSIYFAAQAGAAELSTGALVLLATHGTNVSLLVTGIQADFVKKANSRTNFTCLEGDRIFQAVDKAIQSGEAVKIDLKSEGYQKTGELVSTFIITWSFKLRS